MENKADDELRNYKSPIYPFYYNRKDKRIFVPKLVGVGLTFNFGHWASWLIILVLVVLLPLVIHFGVSYLSN
jgi:uncharacterized membrane protein